MAAATPAAATPGRTVVGPAPPPRTQLAWLLPCDSKLWCPGAPRPAREPAHLKLVLLGILFAAGVFPCAGSGRQSQEGREQEAGTHGMSLQTCARSGSRRRQTHRLGQVSEAASVDWKQQRVRWLGRLGRAVGAAAACAPASWLQTAAQMPPDLIIDNADKHMGGAALACNAVLLRER